jgi:hypothetical protein
LGCSTCALRLRPSLETSGIPSEEKITIRDRQAESVDPTERILLCHNKRLICSDTDLGLAELTDEEVERALIVD